MLHDDLNRYESVRYWFRYCEDDHGAGLHWRKSPAQNRPVGSRAGTTKTDGYRIVKFRGRVYYEHRLIWLFVHGVLPERLDHADLNRSNNRIGNLRLATNGENMANGSLRADNTSGHRGVTKHEGGWLVRVSHIYVGWTKNKNEAIEMRRQAAKKHYGAFARSDEAQETA